LKVVIDTNVLVSAALKDKEPETVLLFVGAHPEFEWIVSPEIVREYKEVLSRDKFKVPEQLLKKWYAIIEHVTTAIDINIELEFPRDPKDAKFLACALAANAEFLITGDKDFTEAKKLFNTTILSVSLFKKLVFEVWH